MNEAVIKEKLSQLSDCLVGSTLLAPNKSVPEGIYVSAKPSTVDESLDFLRLQLKYIIFDLEATRRENRYLRQMLENRNRGGDGGHDS